MARPKKRPDDVALVSQAAEKLDEIGEPALADAVRRTLPELTRVKARDDNPTFTVYMSRETWRTAQQDAKDKSRSVADLIDDGYARLLAGRFKPKPQVTGSGVGKGSFSARASEERRQEVAAYVAAHAEEFDWSPSPQQVAAAWLEHLYGLHGLHRRP